MSSGVVRPLTLAVDETRTVSALWQRPPDARVCYVLAHGAGAGMNHSFLEAVAAGLTGVGAAGAVPRRTRDGRGRQGIPCLPLLRGRCWRALVTGPFAGPHRLPF